MVGNIDDLHRRRRGRETSGERRFRAANDTRRIADAETQQRRQVAVAPPGAAPAVPAGQKAELDIGEFAHAAACKHQ